MTAETKAKLSAVMTGRRDSPETREKKRQGRLGKRHTPETIEKLREAARNMSPETRERMRQATLGRTLSAETRAKVSAGLRGKKRGPMPEDVRRRIAAAKRTPLADRFWSKVDRSGGPDACWPWMSSRRTTGYGQAYVETDDSGHMVYRSAHRVAWTLTNGPIPDGRLVLHRCDQRLCVNPAHLFLGSQADNMQDMVAKGRHWRQPRTFASR